jgi:hypothetical protein
VLEGLFEDVGPGFFYRRCDGLAHTLLALTEGTERDADSKNVTEQLGALATAQVIRAAQQPDERHQARATHTRRNPHGQLGTRHVAARAGLTMPSILRDVRLDFWELDHLVNDRLWVLHRYQQAAATTTLLGI